MQDFVTVQVKESENKRYLFECRDSKSPTGTSLFVKAEATHSGIVNGNARFYRPDRMQADCHTWTPKGKPLKPVLLEHKKDGEVVGRVHKARYVDLSYEYASEFPGVKGLCFYDASAKRLNLFNSVDWVMRNLHGRPDYKGLGYIELDMNIADPGAIQKIQDGRYLTVSVSFATNAAVCSICHTDWAVDDRCEHELGHVYDGKPCFVISGDFRYRECSIVNFPADPWGVITSHDSLKQISDSVANRVFFMGLSRAEQNKRFVLDGARPLVLADSINFLGSDIAPAGDDFEDEDDMDLKAIQSEIKSKELTKERALALRQELEDAEDKAAVKRTLSSLNAKIRANGWAEDGAAVSTESVNARIEGLDAHLATLADAAARTAYVNELADQARALGIEFTPPAEETPAPAAQADGQAPPSEGTPQDKDGGGAPATDQQILDAVEKAFEGADAEATAEDKKKVLGCVQSMESLHSSLEPECRSRMEGCMRALLDYWSAEWWLEYVKGRLKEKGDAVIAQAELDELHTAVEKYEADVAAKAADNQALLKTNLKLIADQKQELARVLVAGSIVLKKPGFQGLNADQIQAEIGERSKRKLNSLQDSLADMLKELSVAEPQATSESRPPEDAVRQVSDTAKVADQDGPQGADPASAEVADNQGEKKAVVLTRLVDQVTARRYAARERILARQKNAAPHNSTKE